MCLSYFILIKRVDNNMKKIFVFCPANITSGGPEALHQLRYYMEKCGIDAWIVYIGSHKKEEKPVIPERYTHFFQSEKKCIWEDDYIDCSGNLIIMPEFFSQKLLHYHKSSKAIWWLSVLAYDGRKIQLDDSWLLQFSPLVRILKKIKYNLKYSIDCIKSSYLYYIRHVKNYCASQFAYEYVMEQKHQKACLLVEPISKEFLDAGRVEDVNDKRKDAVLYNPSKPSKLMDLLLERKNFEFVPLRGYTAQELVNVYREHKLYIDFGKFPGPERIPKEAVYNGCNILVRKHNASINNFDVAIPDKYKITDITNLEMIENKICEMLSNYEHQFADFAGFREKIAALEDNFEKAIILLFKDYIGEA